MCDQVRTLKKLVKGGVDRAVRGKVGASDHAPAWIVLECRYSSLPPGGFWSKKNLGVWTLPKGLIAPGERSARSATRVRGRDRACSARRIQLGDAKQPGGKIVHIWAVQEDWEADLLRSNTFEMEWPPKSGRRQSFPELDRAGWFAIAEARQKILKGQAIFLEHLLGARLA